VLLVSLHALSRSFPVGFCLDDAVGFIYQVTGHLFMLLCVLNAVSKRAQLFTGGNVEQLEIVYVHRLLFTSE